MHNNKKLNKVETDLFIRRNKFSYFSRNHILKSQIKENLNKLHIIICQILTLKILWNFTKNVSQKPYSPLIIDSTLVSDPLRFRKNLLEGIYNNENWL